MSLAESAQALAGFAQSGLPFDKVSLLREGLTQAQGFVNMHRSGGMTIAELDKAHDALVAAQEKLGECEQMIQAAKGSVESAVRGVGGS